MEMLDEALLLEMSLDDIHDKYYNDIPKNDFDYIIAIDPTFNSEKKKKMGQYGKWLLDRFKKHDFDINNHDEINEMRDQLGIFERSKNSLPADKRDIGQFKTVHDLIDFNDKHEVKEKSNLQLRAEQVPGVRFIASNANWEIYSPETWEASKFLRGDNAVWCTGRHDNDHYFQSYTREGKLYIFINRQHANDDREENPNCKLQACIYNKDSNRHSRFVREFENANNRGFMEYGSGPDAFVAFIGWADLLSTLENSELKDIREIQEAKQLEKLKNGEPYIYSKDTVDDDGKVPAQLRVYITKAIVKEGTRGIAKQAFKDCINLESVEIPRSVVSIGTNAFEGCIKLYKGALKHEARIILHKRTKPISVMDKDTKWLLQNGSTVAIGEEMNLNEMIQLKEDFNSTVPGWARNALLSNAGTFKKFFNMMNYTSIPQRPITANVVKNQFEIMSNNSQHGYGNNYIIVLLHSLDGGMFDDTLCIPITMEKGQWYRDENYDHHEGEIEDFINSHNDVEGGLINVAHAYNDYRELSDDREIKAKELAGIPEQDKYLQFSKAVKNRNSWSSLRTNKRLDKSGYAIPDITDIEKKLIQVGKRNYSATLKYFENKVKYLTDWLMNEYSNMYSNVRNVDAATLKRKNSDLKVITDYITSALDVYNAFINRLEKATNTKNPEKSIAKAVDRIFAPDTQEYGIRKNMEGLRRAISYARNAIKHYQNKWYPENNEIR